MSRSKLTIKKGDVYNHLTIIKEVEPDKNNLRRFLCQCSCGNTKEVHLSHLRHGKTRSCGHLAVDELKRKKLAGWNTIKFRENISSLL